jgi:PhnB protein
MIYLKKVAPAIEFYKNAFDAVELRHCSNDDGSVHVAEMSIHGALFRMHEESVRLVKLSPETVKATTIAIGLFVDDPHAVMKKAVAAGGTELDPVTDYDYRQGCLADPFGHHRLLEKKLSK